MHPARRSFARVLFLVLGLGFTYSWTLVLVLPGGSNLCIVTLIACAQCGSATWATVRLSVSRLQRHRVDRMCHHVE